MGNICNYILYFSLNSNYAGHGGGVPDIKIPLNEEKFKEKYINGKDVELDYAIAAFTSK